MKNPTLKDVAELAGVSTATVSYIVNGSRSVSEKSRKKVEAAIKELSYRPNQLARNFKNGKQNTIGFIVPDIANIYFSSIIEEIETVLTAKGINLIIANTKETPENELTQIQSLTNGLVDGLIIASTMTDYQSIAAVLPDGFPVVLVDRGTANCTCDQVLVSSETAMYQGISEFAAAGHRKIGFIAGLKHVYTTNQRILEFREAISRNSLSFSDSQIVYSDPLSCPIPQLVHTLLEDGCTALVAGNNILTMDLMNIALRRKFAGEQEFPILGYSYGEWYSWLPFLNAIEVPTRNLGSLAIRKLLERMETPTQSIKEYVLTCSYRSNSQGNQGQFS